MVSRPPACITEGGVLDDEPACICVCGMPVADSLDVDAYVSTPMVLCDACGGRYVLCPACPQTRVEAQEWDEIKKAQQQKYKAVKCSRAEWERLDRGATATPGECEEFMKLQHYFYGDWKSALSQACGEWAAPVRRRVMRITGICTSQIYGKTWPEATTEQQIRKAVGSGACESLPDNEYCDGDAPDDDETLRWITVDCFDATENEVDGLDLSHDGICVCLRCRCVSCAHGAVVHYSGD